VRQEHIVIAMRLLDAFLAGDAEGLDEGKALTHTVKSVLKPLADWAESHGISLCRTCSRLAVVDADVKALT